MKFKEKDIYLKINNGVLYLFQSQGLLKFSEYSTKINKDIAYVLSYCFNNLSLKEALLQYKQENPTVDLYMITLGIAALTQEKKLLSKKEPWDVLSTIIQENDIYYPECLHIELTSKCNLHCFYCYRKSHENLEESNRLDVNELKNIIVSLSERGLKIAEITGGEPLLHPDLIEIIDTCYNNLSLISIITNGTLIDDLFIEKILPYKSRVLFSISLDSHLPEEHDRRCGKKGSFYKTVNGIKLLSKNGFIVRTAMAVDDNNWSQIEDTILFSKSIGVTKFAYSPILPFGRAEHNSSYWKNISLEDAKYRDSYLKEKYSDFIHYIDKKGSQQLYEKSNCGAGHTSYAMDPFGNIRICATFDETEGVVGSLKTMTMHNLFTSEICSLSSKIPPPKPEICGNCEYLYFCMGCFLRGSKKAPIIGFENCNWAKEKNVKKWLSSINVH
ncbi:MAG: radical SAM protein [Bacteroidales bacterium]|jgi:radical SAM protein with 4Fe4S-binding SPASM domain|nr:radical SAM protein [Bacteroidales bacterium]MDD3692128.1 radical SAM protein [Bacteroidales bacterium]MDX9889420.1 radical SAM protein [Bacteroidales bacterium]